MEVGLVAVGVIFVGLPFSLGGSSGGREDGGQGTSAAVQGLPLGHGRGSRATTLKRETRHPITSWQE